MPLILNLPAPADRGRFSHAKSLANTLFSRSLAVTADDSDDDAEEEEVVVVAVVVGIERPRGGSRDRIQEYLEQEGV